MLLHKIMLDGEADEGVLEEVDPEEVMIYD